VALLDGPVARSHPDLLGAPIRVADPIGSEDCFGDADHACRHGTFVAGILSARRSSSTPGICPGCTLLVRPIFSSRAEQGPRPRAAPGELAAAIVESLELGADVINISGALGPTVGREPALETALDSAARRGAIVVAAAGNEGTVASSPMTRHASVVPVAACDAAGRPLTDSNLARSLGARGVAALGVATSLNPDGPPLTLTGTSCAAAVVSGTCALLWSAFRDAAPQEIRWAVAGNGRRTAVSPPRLDAWAAYRRLHRLRLAA